MNMKKYKLFVIILRENIIINYQIEINGNKFTTYIPKTITF